MPIVSSGELTFSALTYYLYNPDDISPDPSSLYWFYWHTYTWGTSPMETETEASDFYGFAYTASTNPDPITHGNSIGTTSVTITTQNGNYFWRSGSPYTCQSNGDAVSYGWLSVTNINISSATFDASFNSNNSGPSARTGYIGIKIKNENTRVITVTQAGGYIEA